LHRSAAELAPHLQRQQAVQQQRLRSSSKVRSQPLAPSALLQQQGLQQAQQQRWQVRWRPRQLQQQQVAAGAARLVHPLLRRFLPTLPSGAQLRQSGPTRWQNFA
jgi:hypothetical protein